MRLCIAVGVDIGCGMIASQTSLTAEDLPDNLKSIRLAVEAAIPHGTRDITRAVRCWAANLISIRGEIRTNERRRQGRQGRLGQRAQESCAVVATRAPGRVRADYTAAPGIGQGQHLQSPRHARYGQTLEPVRAVLAVPCRACVRVHERRRSQRATQGRATTSSRCVWTRTIVCG
jgi:hypothetical protein